MYESGVGPYSLALGFEIKRHVSSITFGGQRVEDDAMELFLGSFKVQSRYFQNLFGHEKIL